MLIVFTGLLLTIFHYNLHIQNYQFIMCLKYQKKELIVKFLKVMLLNLLRMMQ